MSKDGELLVSQLSRMDSDRMKRYRDNLAFFDGEQWAARARTRTERRLVFNYARALIDKAAAFTLTGLQFVADSESAAPDTDAGAKAKERALATVYEENNIAALEFDSEVDCSVLGDGCFKVWYDVESKRVRVIAPDVQGIFVWTFPGDPLRVHRLAQRYEVGPADLALLVPSQKPASAPPADVQVETSSRRATPPKAHKVVELWTDAVLELVVDGRTVEEKPNPYGFIPYVVYPNVRVPKRFWGLSDIEAVREPQRELNRAMTQLSQILELSGNPIAVLEGITSSADIAVAPGAVWELPESAKAYLLDLLQGGGVQLHTDYVELVYTALHDLGETPRVSFGQADAAVSGVAMELQMDPLIKKVWRKRTIRAAAFQRRNEMVLRLLDQFTGSAHAPYVTRVEWGPLLPAERGRLVADEVALVNAGIHARKTAALVVGVEDPEAEFLQWQDEERAIGEVQAKAPGDAGAPVMGFGA